MHMRITRMSMLGLLVYLLVAVAPVAPGAHAADEKPAAAADATKISFYKQIRPIFQANCHGCHQPAKAKGDYVMTDFAKLLAGGDSDDAAVVPGKPDDSNLMMMVTPFDGVAEMPSEGEPLNAPQLALIRKWIAQGAVDDTPVNARQRYDMDHPPAYTRPPVITSIDYSPDGELLAVAGFHEVLLMKADGSQRVARLVGMSQRIASVSFSPDGSKLAVTGGLPARMGEVQVWDVAKKLLLVSTPVTYDTVYGASWSPDSTKIAFACADNTVRAIDAKTGKQVFFNAAHGDWALDTVFSADGKSLVSVGRDMTTKLYEFETERFIDNVTSITPGALKGGILAIARHPQRDEIVIGGSDGQPKVYRMFRQTKRVIGDDANAVRWLEPMRGRVNAVAVSAAGDMIAAGSSLDGQGQVFIYGYNFDGSVPDNIKAIMQKVVTSRNAAEKKAIEDYKSKDTKTLAKIDLPDVAVYAVAFHPKGGAVAAAGSDGVVRLIDPQSGAVVHSFSPAPVEEDDVQAVAAKGADVDFIRDVNPILSRVGCNAGTCHGSAAGKNGFKLSLRGYDAIFDVRALTDDHAARRVNLASPDDSLMLMKATGAVPHEGGQLFTPDHRYYQTIRDWIAAGAKLDRSVPRVASIDVSPKNPTLQTPGETQAMRVVATYTDGSTRDVTQEAFVETGNAEVALASRKGELTAVRRGEAPVLARYEGAYAATTLTVMGDRSGFTWQAPPTWSRIDELVAAKWQRMKIQPSDLCTDAEFIRRVYLDLTGLPPTADEVRAFLADKRDTRVKRDELIDKLVGSEEYLVYWTNKWADLLQVNRKFLAPEGAKALRDWIRNELETNTPYDDFARKILTADGSNRENPAASYYKILRDPVDIMENTTHLFLGVRFNCNKCHDHPFERWTQDQYYETAAYFARVGLKRDPASGKRNIGGTAVEGAKPLYEVVYEKPEGEITHERTGQVAPPRFPFEADYEAPEDATRRAKLAAWITSPDNPYFARSYVNRQWGYLFGVGIIEPLDDIRAGNPPTNPQLLDYLTKEFIDSGFDVRHVVKLMCKSRTYQLSFRTNKWNEDDKQNYSHALPRRLPAEVIFDAMHRVTGAQLRIPGVPAGTRAAALPDAGVELPSGFLATFGRPARESACECERSNEVNLGPVMALISGPDLASAIDDRNNALTKLVANEKDNEKLINEVFIRVLNRPAKAEEIAATLEEMAMIEKDHAKIAAALNELEAKWAPTLTKQEAARAEAMAKAKADLEAYEKKIAPRIAKAEAERKARIADLEAKLAQAEKDLPQRMVAWEKQVGGGGAWTVIKPTAMKSTNNANLKQEDDGAIFVTGPQGKTQYEIVTETTMVGITGIRLEALADDRLPSKGPGRAQNGNVVVSEFELHVASKDKPTEFRKVAFSGAAADFSQQGYDVKTAIDGQAPDNSNGWAIHPEMGKDHVALFEIAEDIGAETGVILKIVINQQWQDGQHTLGKFRLSLTSGPRPINFGPPQNIADILAVAPDKRDAKQRDELEKYFRSIDPQVKPLSAQLTEARKPLPEDPGLKQRRDQLAKASQPVPIDPDLAELRRIAALSKQQLDNERLTITQDLTWALINSPAFLFNH